MLVLSILYKFHRLISSPGGRTYEALERRRGSFSECAVAVPCGHARTRSLHCTAAGVYCMFQRRRCVINLVSEGQ